MKVRISKCIYGDVRHHTEPLDSWLRDTLNDGHLEQKAKNLAVVLATLLTKLAEKGLLTVEEVIEVTGEYNVCDADQPVQE